MTLENFEGAFIITAATQGRIVTSGLLALVFLLGAEVAPAARLFEVWVQGHVVDEAGEPLEGVQITVRRERAERVIREETNRRGRYRVLLFQGNRPHLFRLEKKGYLTLEHTVQPIKTNTYDDRHRPGDRPEGQAIDLDFTLTKTEGPKAERSRKATDLFNEGVAAAKSTLWSRAEEKFRAALEVDPEMAAAHAALAKVLFEQYRCEESLEAGERALILGASDIELLQVRFECLHRAGEDERAAEALDALAEAAPRRAVPALVERAAGLREADDPEAALEVLERVVEIDPDHARAHRLLGLTLLDLDRVDEARKALRRSLELAPEADGADVIFELLRELDASAGAPP